MWSLQQKTHQQQHHTKRLARALEPPTDSIFEGKYSGHQLVPGLWLWPIASSRTPRGETEWGRRGSPWQGWWSSLGTAPTLPVKKVEDPHKEQFLHKKAKMWQVGGNLWADCGSDNSEPVRRCSCLTSLLHYLRWNTHQAGSNLDVKNNLRHLSWFLIRRIPLLHWQQTYEVQQSQQHHTWVKLVLQKIHRDLTTIMCLFSLCNSLFLDCVICAEEKSSIGGRSNSSRT